MTNEIPTMFKPTLDLIEVLQIDLSKYRITYNHFGENMLTILQRIDLPVDKQHNYREWEWIKIFKTRMGKFDWNFVINKIEELRNKEYKNDYKNE